MLFVLRCDIAGVFLITFVILGNPIISLTIVAIVGMVEVEMLAAMNLWDLDLNPVSLVNLLMSIGVSIGIVLAIYNVNSFHRILCTYRLCMD